MSRPKRWAKACSEAIDAAGKLEEAMNELVEIQGEYQDWLDNLPENLQSSTLGDKLNEVINLDFDSIQSNAGEAQDILSEAEGIDLPRGFGRD